MIFFLCSVSNTLRNLEIFLFYSFSCFFSKKKNITMVVFHYYLNLNGPCLIARKELLTNKCLFMFLGSCQKRSNLYFHGARYLILVILSLSNVIFLITFLRGSEAFSLLIKNRGFRITERLKVILSTLTLQGLAELHQQSQLCPVLKG